jgi:hypothetical protein
MWLLAEVERLQAREAQLLAFAHYAASPSAGATNAERMAHIDAQARSVLGWLERDDGRL